MAFLHGSNLATGSGIARDLAVEGEERGFATSVTPLNDTAGKLKDVDHPVVIVAASYNGKPTDDAAEFVAWLEGLEPGSYDGVEYAVLGLGDHNQLLEPWHLPVGLAVPERVDVRLAAPLLDPARVAGSMRGLLQTDGVHAGARSRCSARPTVRARAARSAVAPLSPVPSRSARRVRTCAAIMAMTGSREVR